MKRYENILHWCKPLDLTMIQHLISHNKFCCQTSLAVALIDWWIVGIHGGFRQSEWCQAQGKATIGNKKVTEKKKKDCPLAFTLDDVKFLTRKKKKLFVSNKKQPRMCPVQAWMRIFKQYKSILKTTKAPTLAVYLDRVAGKAKNITAPDVTNALRKTAKAVYNLNNKELSAFSCHSIRVGACCILFSQGVRPAQIKKLPRWRSNAWTVYLQDLIAIANNQVEAITAAMELPCL